MRAKRRKTDARPSAGQRTSKNFAARAGAAASPLVLRKILASTPWRLMADFRLPLALFIVTRAAGLADLASSDPSLQHMLVLDSERYYEAGRKIAAGGLAGGSEEFVFGPLYAYYVGLVQALGGSWWSIYVSQVCLAGMGLWLLYRIGRAVFGKTSAVLGATLWVLYGASGLLELKVVESTLATTLLLAAVFFLLPGRGVGRGLSELLAGLALGLASLVRPNTLLVLPLLAAHALSRGTWRLRWRLLRRRKLYTATLMLGAALAIAPVTLRNRIVTGHWTLISGQGGITFFQGNNPRAEGSYSAVEGFSGDPVVQAAEAHQIASAATGKDLSPPQVDAYWYGRGVDYLTSNLGDAAALWARKLRNWFSSDELSMEYVLAAERTIRKSLWLMPLPFGVILAASALGFRHKWLVGKPSLLMCVMAANLISTLLFYFASRYRVPSVPMLCLLAGEGLRRTVRGVRPLRLIAAAGVGLFSLHSWSRAPELQQASFYYMLGNQYFKDGEPTVALGYYEKSVAGRPNDWASRHNLGEAYGALGRFEAAVEQLAIAQSLDPQQPSTRRALAYYRDQLANHPRFDR